MVAYEWERTDAGNDAEEGASKDSVNSAVAFIFRRFKPPDSVQIERCGCSAVSTNFK